MNAGVHERMTKSQRQVAPGGILDFLFFFGFLHLVNLVKTLVDGVSFQGFSIIMFSD